MTRAPSHLKARGRRLWSAVLAVYELEQHHRDLLQLACESLDRAAEAQRVLRTEGMFTSDRFGQRVEHPAVGAVRKEAGLCKSLLRELGLDTTTAEEYSRPPHIVGRARSG